MAPTTITKYASDGFSQALADVLEERSNRIRTYVEQDKACKRDELSRFIWGTGRAVRVQIAPDETGQSQKKRKQAWQDAKGMLKELIDFDKFTHTQYFEPCVKNVLEKKTVEVIDAYRHYVLTGEINTKHPPPKLLGETDEILCVDKPCLYTCSYGANEDNAPVPKRAGATSASQLLNGEKGDIQIHEYLALKYNYETAVGTREWWKEGEEKLQCHCGKCDYCACTQSGCCNRLDKETSGVMIAAKTKLGFPDIRGQFTSEHSLESGGTEKYYLALAHGEVVLPEQDIEKTPDWKHSVVDGRGRVEVTMKFDKTQWKSIAWDNGENRPEERGEDGTKDRQWALTFYEPLAWFSNKERNEKYTLLHLQIITGRTHQIRFHCAEVGHPLVGDPTYGAPWVDREWARRVFLHSYQTKFREPFTLRWFEATSPLPEDLGKVLIGLNMERAKEGVKPKLSRRDHPSVHDVFKQYDPTKKLLYSHDPPVNYQAIMAKIKGIEGPEQKGPPELLGFQGLQTLPQDTSAVPGAMQPVTAAVATAGGMGANAGGLVGTFSAVGMAGIAPAAESQWTSSGAAASAGWEGGDWKSNSWEKKDWKSGNWEDAAWSGNDWKGCSWQAEQSAKPLAKQQAQPKAPPPGQKDDDDDDAWGDWTPPPHVTGQAQAQTSASPQMRPRPSASPQMQPQPQPMVQSPLQAQLPQHQYPPMPTQHQYPPMPTQFEPPEKRMRIDPNQAAPGTPPSAIPQFQQQAPLTWKRLESRSQAGVYYYFNSATGQTQVEPPLPWEKRQSRSQPGMFYYWNPLTGVSSPVKPEV